MKHLSGLAELVPDHDGFVVDLWGVLHDGVAPYPGAGDALTRLRDAGKRVVLLSNAPRRSTLVQQALRRMGIADELYTGIMTSGEATCRGLTRRGDAWFQSLGDRVFFLGPERDEGIVREAGLILADGPQNAHFVVVAGPDDLDGPSDISDHEPILRACREAGLPMICANPDLLIVRDGQTIICAGSLATRYEELGGAVRWIGKPDAGIYVPVMDMLAVAPDRVVAVGDALRTDVAGAAAAGLASCWVLSGIHGDDVNGDPAKAETLARAANLAPTFTLPTFAW